MVGPWIQMWWGVLPIAVGKATRLVEFMQEEGKVYEGEITLGYSTTTEDASGEVVAADACIVPLDETLVDEAIASLTGTYYSDSAYVLGCQGQWSQAL